MTAPASRAGSAFHGVLVVVVMDHTVLARLLTINYL
jgi:hypothetical protein